MFLCFLFNFLKRRKENVKKMFTSKSGNDFVPCLYVIHNGLVKSNMIIKAHTKYISIEDYAFCFKV